jgi:hypothetical protein
MLGQEIHARTCVSTLKFIIHRFPSTKVSRASLALLLAANEVPAAAVSKTRTSLELSNKFKTCTHEKKPSVRTSPSRSFHCKATRGADRRSHRAGSIEDTHSEIGYTRTSGIPTPSAALLMFSCTTIVSWTLLYASESKETLDTRRL